MNALDWTILVIMLFSALLAAAQGFFFEIICLAGAVLGFMPFNLSKKWRIFMGDSGSLLLGFISSSLALGTSYHGESSATLLAPVLILLIPIFDTTLVFYLRIKRGISPFLGSKDHFPLRLERMGWKRPHILAFAMCSAIFFSIAAAVIGIGGGVLVCSSVLVATVASSRSEEKSIAVIPALRSGLAARSWRSGRNLSSEPIPNPSKRVSIGSMKERGGPER